MFIFFLESRLNIYFVENIRVEKKEEEISILSIMLIINSIVKYEVFII